MTYTWKLMSFLFLFLRLWGCILTGSYQHRSSASEMLHLTFPQCIHCPLLLFLDKRGLFHSMEDPFCVLYTCCKAIVSSFTHPPTSTFLKGWMAIHCTQVFVRYPWKLAYFLLNGKNNSISEEKLLLAKDPVCIFFLVSLRSRLPSILYRPAKTFYFTFLKIHVIWMKKYPILCY